MARLWRNWPVHNLIGHPLYELCYWIGRRRLGERIHDLTRPGPLPTADINRVRN